MDDAERLAEALLGPSPARAVSALRPALAGDLLRLADAALRRLTPYVAPGSPEAELLRLIAGRPGLSAADLTAQFPRFAAVSRALLADDLVTNVRFERTDCWSRTLRGAQALRELDRQD